MAGKVGNSLSVENVTPSRVSIKLDCLRVGLSETLCCIGRLPRDESLLPSSFAQDCGRKAHQGEALPADFSESMPICCGMAVSAKPRLFVYVYVRGNKRERTKKATTNEADRPCFFEILGHITHTHI